MQTLLFHVQSSLFIAPVCFFLLPFSFLLSLAFALPSRFPLS